MFLLKFLPRFLPSKIGPYPVSLEIHRKKYHDKQGKNKRITYLSNTIDGSYLIIKTSSHKTPESEIIKRLGNSRTPMVLEELDYWVFLSFRYALVIDYAGHQDLSDVVEGNKFKKPDDRLYFARNLAEFLNYLHNEKRIVHGDIKPEHFIFENGLDSWKLVDYGFSRFINDPDWIIRGRDRDLDFCAPEISKGQTPETDMYSFGAILYFIHSERPPFQYFSQKITEKPNLRLIPQNLTALVGSLLEYKPENRPTAEEAVKELDNI